MRNHGQHDDRCDDQNRENSDNTAPHPAQPDDATLRSHRAPLGRRSRSVEDTLRNRGIFPRMESGSQSAK